MINSIATMYELILTGLLFILSILIIRYIKLLKAVKNYNQFSFFKMNYHVGVEIIKSVLASFKKRHAYAISPHIRFLELFLVIVTFFCLFSFSKKNFFDLKVVVAIFFTLRLFLYFLTYHFLEFTNQSENRDSLFNFCQKNLLLTVLFIIPTLFSSNIKLSTLSFLALFFLEVSFLKKIEAMITSERFEVIHDLCSILFVSSIVWMYSFKHFFLFHRSIGEQILFLYVLALIVSSAMKNSSFNLGIRVFESKLMKPWACLAIIIFFLGVLPI